MCAPRTVGPCGCPAVTERRHPDPGMDPRSGRIQHVLQGLAHPSGAAAHW